MDLCSTIPGYRED
ncbi:hypothetical protein Zm00014a_034867 [Zea mays]|uniref:Uncharacterized protein n=1 Tax=Zea mays TaxID=4577 RepID=A0A3L6EDX5_MAIZE|nr:hypothetical protein Zm00014a_034867 [Zea mays]